ncbi:MAG TPA: HlyD family efflux transporter periplasmic adaptor subunit [Steroidobacteraceae bacterium]|nr:HlyD family efflux transporter periplasmic adaptor subunit [Steroidobacteraceae bacterium]
MNSHVLIRAQVPGQGPFERAPSEPEPSERGSDGGMDRKVDRTRSAKIRRAGIVAIAAVAAITVLYFVVSASSSRSVKIAGDSLTIATVTSGEFSDYVPLRGTVTPLRTVYLDAMDGGRVEAILVEEGASVVAGQPILQLGNTALQLDVMSREAEVSEQVNNLRNTRLALEQNRLSLQNELTQINYQLTRLEKLAARRAELASAGLIARQDSEDAADELEYYRTRRANTLESQKTDELMRKSQIQRLEATVEQLQKNLLIAQRNLDGLVVKAPIAGQLTSFDAEIGESKARGQRLGQVDEIEGFKITAPVDEFYLTRLRKDQVAQFKMNGNTYTLHVAKIYPEVRDGKFDIDLRFDSATTLDMLRRGQSLQLRLALGDSTEAVLLANGGFFQDTGGNWVFVLDGNKATRRDVQLGRRNPELIEVIGGLQPGDRVITSTYSNFIDMNQLVLTGEP